MNISDLINKNVDRALWDSVWDRVFMTVRDLTDNHAWDSVRMDVRDPVGTPTFAAANGTHNFLFEYEHF